MGRWLSGRTRPRLPDFLRLVEAMTGRASDLVAELVDIASIPSLADVHARRRATRRLAYEHPYAAGALTLIEVGVPPGIPAAAYVARALRIPEPAAAEVLEALADAGVARDDGQGWRVVAPLTVDVRASPDDVRGLKRTWARVALERLDAPDPRDLHAFNLITVSAADLERVRELQRAWFRELRALVAASAPSEVAAVVVAQLVVLADGSGCAAPP